MSWSVAIDGSKEEITAKLDVSFAAAADRYKAGTLEGDDIVAAKGRCAALVAAYAGDKKLSVSAYGSHSTSEKTVLAASFHVDFREVTSE